MENKRNNQRANCYARVDIGNFENIGFVKDFSKTGIKIHAASICTYKDGTTQFIKILENKDLEIGEVNCEAKLIWHTVSSAEILYGFHLQGFKDKTSQTNYKQFLESYKKAFQSRK